MKSAAASSLAVVSLAAVAQARTMTVYNGCPFTIWPAMFTDLVRQLSRPSLPSVLYAHACVAIERWYRCPLLHNWVSPYPASRAMKADFFV